MTDKITDFLVEYGINKNYKSSYVAFFTYKKRKRVL